jgi:predicted acetyltransferase
MSLSSSETSPAAEGFCVSALSLQGVLMTDLSVRPATTADRSVLERLWLMFRHDLSGFDGQRQLPNQDGTFRSERLHSALTDPDWAAYLLQSGDRPAGLVFVRSLSGPARVLNSLFVVRGLRRSGVGLRAVRAVVANHPGRWEVAFQDQNEAAVHFWRRVATEIAGDAWTEERRPISSRLDLPPDVWIAFDTAPA